MPVVRTEFSLQYDLAEAAKRCEQHHPKILLAQKPLNPSVYNSQTQWNRGIGSTLSTRVRVKRFDANANPTSPGFPGCPKSDMPSLSPVGLPEVTSYLAMYDYQKEYTVAPVEMERVRSPIKKPKANHRDDEILGTLPGKSAEEAWKRLDTSHYKHRKPNPEDAIVEDIKTNNIPQSVQTLTISPIRSKFNHPQNSKAQTEQKVPHYKKHIEPKVPKGKEKTQSKIPLQEMKDAPGTNASTNDSSVNKEPQSHDIDGINYTKKNQSNLDKKPAASQKASTHKDPSKDAAKKSKSKIHKKGILKTQADTTPKKKRVSIDTSNRPDDKASTQKNEISEDSLPLGAEYHSLAYSYDLADSNHTSSNSGSPKSSHSHSTNGSEGSSEHYHHQIQNHLGPPNQGNGMNYNQGYYGSYPYFPYYQCCHHPMYFIVQPPPPPPPNVFEEKASMMPVRTHAFTAPYVHMPWMSASPDYESSDSESNSSESRISNSGSNSSRTQSSGQCGMTGFQYTARPDCATEVSLTVEPRKQPMWQTMLGCGFRPVINCQAPPYMMNPAEEPPGNYCGHKRQRTQRRRTCRCAGRGHYNQYYQRHSQQSHPPAIPAGSGQHPAAFGATKMNKKENSSNKSSYAWTHSGYDYGSGSHKSAKPNDDNPGTESISKTVVVVAESVD